MKEDEVALEGKTIGAGIAAPRRRPVKIPVELRKTRRVPQVNMSSWSRFRWRLKHDSQYLRTTVQLTFLFLCLWIGLEFILFVESGSRGDVPLAVGRPPGVEGFLPISAQISQRYWLQTGIINSIHPSGMFILLGILLVSVIMKKAFCSWMCPVGTVSESLWKFGNKLFKRNLRVPRWLDFPLRSIKYLVLGFFIYVIGSMDIQSLGIFIDSPYNRMADVKMYLFFAHISSFAFWTILAFVLFSVVIKNFWCRYLCPYGGLLGILSILSPLKVTRHASTCIDCDLCTRACPSGIKVHAAHRVWSDECTACYECVDACPVKNTLAIKASASSKPVPSWVFGALLVAVFAGLTGLAMVTGHWNNSISQDEYRTRFNELDGPAYEHFGSTRQ